jgi:HEAT repeat protein
MTGSNGSTQLANDARDRRPVHELISAALSEPDEDLWWTAITTLHERGTREVLVEGVQLCESGCTVERRLGVDILGQLGYPKRSFPEESSRILLTLLETEREGEVIAGIVTALANLESEQVSGVSLGLRTHQHADVRFAVVLALGSSQDPRAIPALIELTRDRDAFVRDWATFELGSIIEVDTPEIRNALVARLDDAHDETRHEAIVGLAARKDRRVMPALLEAI